MRGTKWSSIVSVEIPKYGFLFLHKVAVKFCIPQTGYVLRPLTIVHIPFYLIL